MVEEVEELQPELQLGALPQFRYRPVLVQSEVHIPDVRAVALAGIAEWPLAKDIAVHGEGVLVDIPQIVTAEAGLSRHHQRTNAEVGEGAVTYSTPRIPANGPGARDS